MTTATLIRTDRGIQADVLAELRWENSVPGIEIGVAVKDGVVTLTRTVDTFLKKWRAVEDVHKVNGVIAVANDITARVIASVRIPTSQRPRDTRLSGLDEIHPGEEHIGGIVYQTPTWDKAREPDASALERGSELDEQIFRLQCLVSHLLEKNEELRQRLARQASGKEGQRFIGERSGVH